LTWATESMGTAPFTYNVLRSTSSSGPFTTICSGITSLCYTNTGTTKGTKYYFCVTATNCKGTGANSPTASCTSN
jgi:cellulose 1,4-beta-cellobiosidase